MANNESKNWILKNDVKNNDWASIPPGLWKYRCGDFTAACDWCELGLAAKNNIPAADATLHIILAMAEYQRGQASEACSELAQGRLLVEAKLQNGLDHGKSGIGYWYDWIFASILLKEATSLVDCSFIQPETQ